MFGVFPFFVAGCKEEGRFEEIPYLDHRLGQSQRFELEE